MTAAEVLGLLGFVLALVSLGLQFWNMFFRKPYLAANLKWKHVNGELRELIFTIMNTGHRKAIVTRVGYRARDDASPEHFGSTAKIHDALPIVIDVNEATPTMSFPLSENIASGNVYALVVVERRTRDRDRLWEFPFPEMPTPDDPMFRPS